jgi:hypothetical protein
MKQEQVLRVVVSLERVLAKLSADTSSILKAVKHLYLDSVRAANRGLDFDSE